MVSAISLLVETIIGIRRKQFWEKELILASGQRIYWLVEIILFFIFQKLLPGIVYFPSNWSVFFNGIFHSNWWKRIFWLVETVFLRLEFFLQVETVTYISGSQIFKKEIVSTDFVAS